MTTENTATAKDKKISALNKLLDSLKGQPAPNKTDIKAAGDKFKKRMGEREKLVKALEDFDAATGDLATTMVKCFGRQHIAVDGVRYVPTSRGERIYYKRMSDEHETVEL